MNKRVSSTVTKRKANPRPRKYASASERQAAYRARAPELCFRAEPKTVETLDRIAETLDQSRADVLLSMTKFALANHDWARFGLTHKPLPFEYGVNPVKMTKRQEVIEFGKRMGFKASAGKGFVYLTNMVGWGETFDDWDQAHAYLLKAYDDHYVNRTPYPWDYKGNPTKTTRAEIEWKAYTIPGAEDTVYQGAYKGYLGTVRKKDGVWSLLLMKDNKTRTPLGIWDSKNGQASGAKAWLEIVVDDESWKHLKGNPTMKAKRKPTPAQMAARERFAEMARSGAFKKAGASRRKKNPDGMGSYGPFYGATDAPMTEAQIERKAESYMDRLDRQLMGNEITQTVYDREVKALDKWTKEQYAKRRRRNPAKPAASRRGNPAPKRQRMLNISWLTPGGEREIMSVPIEFTFTEYVGNVAERFFARMENGFLIVSEYSTGGKVGQVPHTMRAAALNDNAAAKQFTREMIQRVGPERFRAAIKKFSKIN